MLLLLLLLRCRSPSLYRPTSSQNLVYYTHFLLVDRCCCGVAHSSSDPLEFKKTPIKMQCIVHQSSPFRRVLYLLRRIKSTPGQMKLLLWVQDKPTLFLQLVHDSLKHSVLSSIISFILIKLLLLLLVVRSLLSNAMKPKKCIFFDSKSEMYIFYSTASGMTQIYYTHLSIFLLLKTEQMGEISSVFHVLGSWKPSSESVVN